MRVQVSVPSLDHCPIEFALSLAALFGTPCVDTRLGRSKPVAVSLAHCQNTQIPDARERLIDQAIESGATHVFFLDSDMVFPPTALSTLVSHHKPIVGASYVKRFPPHEILGNALPSGVPLGPLHPMLHMPLGCMLISLDVFRAMPKPWFNYHRGPTRQEDISEDTHFCNAARTAGHTIYLDRELTRSIGHVGSKTFRPSDTLQLGRP